MRKKLFVSLFSLFLGSAPCWAESVEESLKHCGERVRQLSSQPGVSNPMVLQDLNKVQTGLDEMQQCFQGQRPYSSSELGQALSHLQQGLAGMRVSSCLMVRPSDWTEVEPELLKLHRALKRSTDLFDGRALPTLERLRHSDLDQPTSLTIESVKDLERDSRAMRFDFENLLNPGMLGPFGRNSAGFDAWTGQDLQRLRQAIADYESVCRSHYSQVLETQVAFEKVVRAYDRLGYYGNEYPSAPWRSLGRQIGRLQKFYAALR